MRKKLISVCACLLLCVLAGCNMIAPEEKTYILRETTPVPMETAAIPSTGFEMKKMYTLPLDKLNPEGLVPDPLKCVIHWLDNDNMLAMAVTSAEGGGVEAELGSISYQYGFYNELAALPRQVPENIAVSNDRTRVVYQLEDPTVGKYTVVYSLADGVQLRTIDTFRTYSPPLWNSNDDRLAFAASVNGKYCVTLLNLGDGTTRNVGEMQSTALSVQDYLSDGTLLVRHAAGDDGYSLELIDTLNNQSSTIFTGKLSQCSALSESTALVLAGDTLRLIGKDSTAGSVIEDSVQSYAFTDDRKNIALAQINMDGSVDIVIGQWGGSRVINKSILYKNIGADVTRMLFSPDSAKLYVEYTAVSGQQAKTAVVLELA